MKYYVKFKWIDIQGDLQTEKKEFENKNKAKKFYEHIKKTTQDLIEIYGVSSLRYNPYRNIELVIGEE